MAVLVRLCAVAILLSGMHVNSVSAQTIAVTKGGEPPLCGDVNPFYERMRVDREALLQDMIQAKSDWKGLPAGSGLEAAYREVFRRYAVAEIKWNDAFKLISREVRKTGKLTDTKLVDLETIERDLYQLRDSLKLIPSPSGTRHPAVQMVLLVIGTTAALVSAVESGINLYSLAQRKEEEQWHLCADALADLKLPNL
ncbi:hypothetical protein [Azospirillum sp. TSO22-1]|uniref:hypothetical protein n=1 Tax=Azospirillum sp. TSO22-1 TaxID=716789 RepID=UPI000D61E81E|nr:hypothetical protein [Azospirillum sp. TSO22-1]PWC43103.1 hypothetical protein TSO221_20465 [Azospirillum sp. TSO22-1]